MIGLEISNGRLKGLKKSFEKIGESLTFLDVKASRRVRV